MWRQFKTSRMEHVAQKCLGPEDSEVIHVGKTPPRESPRARSFWHNRLGRRNGTNAMPVQWHCNKRNTLLERNRRLDCCLVLLPGCGKHEIPKVQVYLLAVPLLLLKVLLATNKDLARFCLLCSPKKPFIQASAIWLRAAVP